MSDFLNTPDTSNSPPFDTPQAKNGGKVENLPIVPPVSIAPTSNPSVVRPLREAVEDLQAFDIYTVSSSSEEIPLLSSFVKTTSPSLTTLASPFVTSPSPTSTSTPHIRCHDNWHTSPIIGDKRFPLGLPVLREEESPCASPTSGGVLQAIVGRMGGEDPIGGILSGDNGDEEEDGLESWVDLSKHTSPSPTTMSQPPAVVSTTTTISSTHASMIVSPDRTPPSGSTHNGEEYLRLLREAQKESNQSSARVSLASSRRDSLRGTPKSPPNSPNTELCLGGEDTQLKGVYINYYNKDGDFIRVDKNTETDWIWDWSSRPDQRPPKEWHFTHPRRSPQGRGGSMRKARVGAAPLFSRDVLYTLLLTNVLSLLLGTGIGLWISKRSGAVTVSSAINTYPFN